MKLKLFNILSSFCSCQAKSVSGGGLEALHLSLLSVYDMHANSLTSASAPPFHPILAFSFRKNFVKASHHVL